MKRAWIFLTNEGYTFMPNSTAMEPDVENSQMLGIAYGETAEKAFEELLAKNEWLENTTFEEVFCYPLANTFESEKQYFLIPKEK